MRPIYLLNTENRLKQRLLGAILAALLIGLIALMQNSDERAKQPDEHHWGKPSVEQQQSYREDAREQRRLSAIVAQTN